MLTDTNRRISVSQFSTFRWSFFEDIVRYAAHGIDSVGIWRRKLDDFGASSSIDLLYEMKMSVSSVNWTGGFTGDGQSFSDSIEDAIGAIQLAGRLNAGCLIVHPGARNGHTTKHAHRLLKSALSNLVPVATDYGVKLVLKPLTDNQLSPWTFIEKFDDWISILNEFSSPNLGLVLDTYHIGFDSRVFELMDQFIDRVELVQLADRNLLLDRKPSSIQSGRRYESYRLPLGKGQVPLEAWLGKLQSLGYRGQYELEVHGSEVEEIDYRALLDATVDYFSDQRINSLIQSRADSEITSQPLELGKKLID
jgi:sugar phosphate isomerase/epimerase